MKASLIVFGLMLPIGIAIAQNPANPQSGKTTQQPSGSKESTSAKTDEQTGNAAELRTQTYKGALVDASCAAGATNSTTPPGQSTADRSSSSKTSAETAPNKKGEANRTGDSGQNCGVSASTSDFGLRMKDGHIMRFDAVGNERAKEAFAAKKKWSDTSAGGKALPVTVSGIESGDRLTVVSIH
jgi:hypothetical protein